MDVVGDLKPETIWKCYEETEYMLLAEAVHVVACYENLGLKKIAWIWFLKLLLKIFNAIINWIVLIKLIKSYL